MTTLVILMHCNIQFLQLFMRWGFFKSYLCYWFVFSFAENNARSFCKYSLYLSQTHHHKNALKLSVGIFIVILITGCFLSWFLKSDMFSPRVSYVIVATLSGVLISSGSVSFSYYLTLNAIKSGADMKKSLVIFYLCQIPLQVFFFFFLFPCDECFLFKNKW